MFPFTYFDREVVSLKTNMASVDLTIQMYPRDKHFFYILGCAISLVEAQIKNITYEQFQSKPRVFERLKQFSRAIGLFIMPHFVFHMAFLYGITNAQMIYSALLLNVIPSVLILTFKKKTDYRYSLNKYRTISG